MCVYVCVHDLIYSYCLSLFYAFFCVYLIYLYSIYWYIFHCYFVSFIFSRCNWLLGWSFFQLFCKLWFIFLLIYIFNLYSCIPPPPPPPPPPSLPQFDTVPTPTNTSQYSLRNTHNTRWCLVKNHSTHHQKLTLFVFLSFPSP